MTYASASFGGAATPTYLTSTITATDMTATFHDLTDWVEVDSTGAATTQPLGTSGPFCIKLSWGTAHEETVQCSGLDPLTGVITFAQRGFDGTTAQAHTASTKANCFPTDTATDWINVQDAISTATADSATALATALTAESNASTALSEASSALSAANTKVASVTAADGTITIAGTSTAPTVKVNALATTGIYNVKSYGAVGNGSTDDTAAIQAAINAATFGGIIFFPPGRYIVSATLNLLVDGTEIVGSGNSVNGGTVIKTASSFTSGDVFYLNNKTGRNFRDFSIQYTTTPTSGFAINQAAGGGDSIENVRISWYNGINSNGHILSVHNCDVTAINDCFVQTAGIMRVSDVVAGHSSGSTGAGFRIDQGANTTRIVTSQTQNGGYGVILTNSVSPGTNNPSFFWSYDLEINNPTNDGFFLQYGSQVYITNAWVSGAGLTSGSNHGINVASTFVGDVNISDTQIQDMPGHGIFLQGGSGFQISNTQIGGCSFITNNTYDAIHINSGVTKVMLSAIQTNSTPYYGKTSRYGLFVDTGATVWRDTSSEFAGITGSVSNAGTINQYLQGLPVGYGTPPTGSLLTWDGSKWTGTRWLTTQAIISTSQTLVRDFLYLVDASSGDINLTLPGTSTYGGAMIAVNFRTGSNTVTLTAPSGVTINGSLSSIKLTKPGQSVFLTYYGTGTSWNIISGSAMPVGVDGFSVGGDLSGVMPNPSVVAGSTTVAGKLQLTDSTSSTSTTTAATPNAVKSAYDLASTANTAAGAAQTTANAKVASVTAGDSTVTVGGTATAPTVKVTANTFDPYGAAAAKVASVAAGDTSIAIGGTATAPTVAVNQANLVIAESQVTNLTTDLAAKVPTSRTITPQAPLSGGGDLSANRTLSIADASTTTKGAVQLTDSTSSTSLTTAATPNSVKTAYDLANAALPKSGGTMSGRIQNLSLPGAATDPARAGDFGATVPPSLHGLTAWTYDPGAFAGGTLTLATGVCYFTAIYVPYAMTVSKIWGFINTGGIAASSGTILNMGLYNSTTLLASTGNQSAFIGVTGAAGFSLTSPYAIATPGVYWIGLLYVQGTGGTPSAPTWQKGGQTTNTIVNMNVANSNTSLLNQRAASSASRTALPTDLTALSNITFNQHLMLMGLS